MDSPEIRVTYVGRQPLSWWPDGTDMGVPSTTTTLPAALEERQRTFLRFIEAKLKQVTSDSFSPVDCARKKRKLWEAFVAISDPVMARHLLTEIPENELDENGQPLAQWLLQKLFVIQGFTDYVDEQWTQKNGDGGLRPAADKYAQTMVRSWYRNKCVLTQANKTEGAHIVPVRVTQAGCLPDFWNVLAMVWPVDRLADLAYKGRESTNILPLSRGAHARWDAYEFLLRPVPDPVNQDTRIYLQMVWTEELTVGDPRGDGVLVEVSNGCCPVNDASYPPVQTGDVFCLETTDPLQCPLPKLEFLQVQHGVHRILGGLRAASTLADIFRGGPPDDDMGNSGASGADLRSLEDEDVPHIWRVLLEAAIAKNIMDLHDAGRWARAFAQQSRREQRFWAGEESDINED